MCKIDFANTYASFSNLSFSSVILIFNDDILKFIFVLDLLIYDCFRERKHSAKTLRDFCYRGDFFFTTINVTIDHLY